MPNGKERFLAFNTFLGLPVEYSVDCVRVPDAAQVPQGAILLERGGKGGDLVGLVLSQGHGGDVRTS